MRYTVNFYSTNDESIKRVPSLLNIGLKRDCLKLELCHKQIPYSQIKRVTINHNPTESQLSPGKAVVGGVIAGPVGAIVGTAMGGTKVVSTIKFEYLNDDGEMREVIFKTKLAEAIAKKFEKKSKKYR